MSSVKWQIWNIRPKTMLLSVLLGWQDIGGIKAWRFIGLVAKEVIIWGVGADCSLVIETSRKVQQMVSVETVQRR